jgi:hypothetical protein
MTTNCLRPLLLALLGAAACSSGSDVSRSRSRDLTMAAVPAQDAVLGAAERITPPEAGSVRTAPLADPAPRPRMVRRAAVPAAPAPEAALAPAPVPVEQPVESAAEPVADSWAGSDRALEPGQATGVVPVAMGSGARMPQTDLVSERGIRWMGMVHGDDRCIPGRDQLVPGFRARRN